MKEGWEYKKLGEVASIKSGYTPSSSDLMDCGNIPYFKVGDMNNVGNEKYLQYSSSYVNDTFKSFPKGSIVFPKNGAAIATNKKRILKQLSVVDLNTAVLIPTQKENVEFLYYWISNIDFRDITRRGTVPTLDTKTLMKLDVPHPPIVEQERIVEELDLLSSIIDKKKAQLKEYDQLAQSIFYDMFGDPITNEKGWEVKKLSDNVHEMFLGPFGSALKVDSYVTKEEAYCMVYEQKHAIQNTLNLDNHYINKEKYESLKRFEVKPHDFIMSCRGTIGKLYQLPINAPIGIIHPSLMKIRIKENAFNSTFFKFMLVKIVANESTNGNCVQMAITAKELGKKELPLPPLSLQQEFASKVEAIERQKSLIQQSIVETQTLFDSRMDYWFG